MAYFRPLQLQTILNQPNPHIDLKLEEYDRTTKAFTTAVQSYVTRAVEEISRRKEAHTATLRKEAERRKQVEGEITDAKLKEIELMKDLEREQIERKEAETIVSGYKRQLASAKEKCAAVETEIQQISSTVSSLRSEKGRERDILESRAKKVDPVIELLEESLGFRIQGVQQDVLLFKFTQIDPSHPEREFQFVLDVSERTYRVRSCNPNLPELGDILDELNETRDIYTFIRTMRTSFIDSVS